MEQILLNLAVNARDAMPEGGRLTIETKDVERGASDPESQPPVASEPCVLLVVRDTGVGMDAETRAHAFEPFFTNKETEEGTGLGLATVYGIVKQSGGHIRLHSEVGRGTRFELLLPRVDEPAEETSAAAEPSPAPRGTEAVLVVEDEGAVRSLVARSLRGLGYTVLEAADVPQAMERLADPAVSIGLLLTDVVLPGAGGKALVGRARSLRPKLKVLYMSGYATPILTQRGILEPGVQLLQKPFTRASLARRVRQVLEAED
jgi:CheY-like chemotaxis protein